MTHASKTHRSMTLRVHFRAALRAWTSKTHRTPIEIAGSHDSRVSTSRDRIEIDASRRAEASRAIDSRRVRT
jgi:hypothetical protein